MKWISKTKHAIHMSAEGMFLSYNIGGQYVLTILVFPFFFSFIYTRYIDELDFVSIIIIIFVSSRL